MLKGNVCAALIATLGDGIDVHRCAAARALGAVASPSGYEPLIKALLDEDADVRTDAASALTKLGDDRSAAAMMDSLIGDPCGEVKLAAITALVGLRHQPVIPWLRRLAVSRDEEIAWDDDEFYGGAWDDWLDIQIAAIRGLADLGVEDGVPEIVAAYEDEMGQDLSAPVINALLRLGEPGAKALDDLFTNGDTQLRRNIASALTGGNDGDCIGALRNRCLMNEIVEVRRAAIAGLIKEAPDDERIEPFFDDSNASVRETVIELAGTHYPAATRRSLEDTNPRVRRTAFAVVADRPELFDNSEIADVLRRAIAAKTSIPPDALVAWARVEPDEALPALAHALKTADNALGFRRGIVRGLACIGTPALPVLTTAAVDHERQVRLDALTALAEQARSAKTWPNEAGDIVLEALAGELLLAPEVAPDAATRGGNETQNEAAIGKSTVVGDTTGDWANAAESSDEGHPLEQPAQAMMQADIDGLHAKPPDRDQVSEADRGSMSTLQTILSGRDDMEPTSEASPEVELTDKDRALLELAGRRAISKKKMSLESSVAPHRDVRSFAARLLGDIHNEAIVTFLVGALQCDDRDLRHAALESLGEVGAGLGRLPTETMDVLSEIVTSDDVELRMFAIRALGFIKAPQVDTQLQELVSDPNAHIRLEAIRALDARGEINASVAGSLKDENTGVRLAAAKAMATHCPGDAVEPLVDFAFFADGMHRREAGGLLAEIAPEQSAGQFLEILADKSRVREWLVAIEALGEIAVCLDAENEYAAV